jgi:hypothetical protein
MSFMDGGEGEFGFFICPAAILGNKITIKMGRRKCRSAMA